MSTKSKSQNESDSANDLQSKIVSLQEDNNRLQIELDSANETILNLQIELEKQINAKDGRKSQVLNLLKERESISILELAENIGISTKNVSSQLTYLRQDGYKIFTDHNGRKVLMK